MINKVALVTGANKGIGFGIVRELCKRGVAVVYLASRDVERGQKAVEKLTKEGFTPILIQLDTTNRDSVKAAADKIKANHKGLDVLINNAAVIDKEFHRVDYEDSKMLLNTNYRSAFTIKEYLYPILNDNARVIYISSDCGHISNIKNEFWVKTLTKKDVQVEEVNEFVNWFLNSVKNKTLKAEDFGVSHILAYRVSKVAVTALARIHQRDIKRNIAINSIHPGFVQTDMTQGHGYITVEKSALAPVHLALDAPQELKGAYLWFDMTEKDWADSSQELFSKKVNLLD